MARIRTIKPEFFTSEDIVSLTPLARLLYIALWCEADREGRMAWKPKTFKMRYFPGDSCNIEKLCDELIDSSLVICYGEKYAFIPAFHAHQHINPRESATQIPEPDIDASSTRAPRVSTSANLDVHSANQDMHAQVGREGKGREGKGMERKGMIKGFAEFWDAWPKSERKQDKSKCSDKWSANNLEEKKEEILADIAVKKCTQKWQGGFIEAPEVYLNNRRWEDGVQPDSVNTPYQSNGILAGAI